MRRADRPGRFAARAYRRPVTDAEVARLVKVYQNARSENETFQRACQLMLEAALVSPQFIYRIEIDPADHPRTPHPLSDYELATRLSYFLWSSMPDDALLAAAGAGTLHQPDVLREQVTAHDRRSALVGVRLQFCRTVARTSKPRRRYSRSASISESRPKTSGFHATRGRVVFWKRAA